MSHCVLQGMSTDPRGVFVSGFPWAPNGRWLRPETLVSPILCTAHNTALSGLDSFAQSFAGEFARIHDALISRSNVSTVVRFNGNNLERWLLKTLSGLVASGMSRTAQGARLSSSIPDLWLPVQYGLADFIGTAGFYVPGRIRTVIPTASGIFNLAPLSTDDGRVVGLQATLPLFHGILVAGNFPGRPEGALDSESVRRPSALVWTDGRVEHRIEFTWNQGRGPAVMMMYEHPAPTASATP